MHRSILLAALAVFAAPLFAASADITIDIPRLDVSEYHRPYIAVWIERDDRSVAANLAAWYQLDGGKDANTGKQETGTKWLSDLRQWWRRSGRDQTFPVDGVSGATRPVGQHRLAFSSDKAPGAGLAAGHYKLLVEAAREVGGHEVLSIPFDWPPTAPQQLAAQGEHELGALRLDLNP